MYQAHTQHENQAAENARGKVTEYCRQEKMTQKAFGEMIGLSNKHGGTIGRFMCDQSGARGKAYPAIIGFFRIYDPQQKLKERKEKRALANKEKKETKMLAKKEEKEKLMLAKKAEKEKLVLAKKEEKEKKALAKKEKKGKKVPANKEEKVSTKRKGEEGASVSPRSITDHSPGSLSSSKVDEDHLATKGAKIEVEVSSSTFVEGAQD
jgi:hypothetical protein